MSDSDNRDAAGAAPAPAATGAARGRRLHWRLIRARPMICPRWRTQAEACAQAAGRSGEPRDRTPESGGVGGPVTRDATSGAAGTRANRLFCAASRRPRVRRSSARLPLPRLLLSEEESPIRCRGLARKLTTEVRPSYPLPAAWRCDDDGGVSDVDGYRDHPCRRACRSGGSHRYRVRTAAAGSVSGTFPSRRIVCNAEHEQRNEQHRGKS